PDQGAQHHDQGDVDRREEDRAKGDPPEVLTGERRLVVVDSVPLGGALDQLRHVEVLERQQHVLEQRPAEQQHGGHTGGQQQQVRGERAGARRRSRCRPARPPVVRLADVRRAGGRPFGLHGHARDLSSRHTRRRAGAGESPAPARSVRSLCGYCCCARRLLTSPSTCFAAWAGVLPFRTAVRYVLIGFGSFSTAAHCGISGVVPPTAAAGAAASAGALPSRLLCSDSLLGMTPLSLASWPSNLSESAIFRNSLASSCFLLPAATARLEPPRKTPSGLSAVAPGMVK